MGQKQITASDQARWLMLIYLSIALIFSISTWFSATAVIPQLTELWALSPTASAWMTIAVQLGFVIGAVISSLFNLADIVSSRFIIMAGSIGAGIANALLLVAAGPAVGIPLRFATGFFVAGVYPPAFKLISTWFREKRGLALGILAAALVIGNGTPHLINGLGGLEWEVAITVTSLQALLGGLIAALLVREGPYPFPKAAADLRQVGLALTNRGVRLATLGYVGYMWELFAMSAWILLFFGEVFSFHGIHLLAAAPIAVFLVHVFGGAGSWIGGVLGDRWGRTNTTILLMAVSGTCAVLIGLVYQWSLALVLILGSIWGVTIVGDSAQFSAMVTETADQSYVGTALTVQLAAGFAVTVVTIWLLPFLQAMLSWRWAFAPLAIGPFIGIFAMLRLKSLPESAKIGGGRG